MSVRSSDERIFLLMSGLFLSNIMFVASAHKRTRNNTLSSFAMTIENLIIILGSESEIL